MEQITKPHCGARLDRLPDCRWHSSMFAIVAFGLLVCWSNAVGGLILAQLKALGWTDNSTTATFLSNHDRRNVSRCAGGRHHWRQNRSQKCVHPL